MVFYKPYAKNQDISAWFPDAQLSDTAVYGAYTALENEKIIGKCLVQITGTACEILDLETETADALLIEGLVRSALHFAGNRGAYTAACRLTGIRDVLLLLGFSEENGVFRGTVPELLAGSCCKHNS